jgi:hypothetical protein
MAEVDRQHIPAMLDQEMHFVCGSASGHQGFARRSDAACVGDEQLRDKTCIPQDEVFTVAHVPEIGGSGIVFGKTRFIHEAASQVLRLRNSATE